MNVTTVTIVTSLINISSHDANYNYCPVISLENFIIVNRIKWYHGGGRDPKRVKTVVSNL